MFETPDFREWQGMDIQAVNGEKIGSLEEVYFDSETDEPTFLLIKSGLFGRHLTFVPVDGIKPGQTYLQVAKSQEEIKQAPTLESGSNLSTEDEARIYRYYGLEYGPPASGRRLVRR